MNSTVTSQTGPFSSWPKNESMSPSDFTYIMKIGKGSFGHVFLAQRNDPNDDKYYAIKILSKQLIMGTSTKRCMYSSVGLELMTIVNPFYECFFESGRDF